MAKKDNLSSSELSRLASEAVDEYKDKENRKILHLEKALTHLSAIMAWQVRGDVIAITCPNNSTHKPLVGVWDGIKVGLRCLDCDFTQNSVPPVALFSWKDRLEREEKDTK